MWTRVFSFVFLYVTAIWAGDVVVRFDPSKISVGPFPTDYLTVADSNQKTGLRIQLPMSDCSREPSMCVEYSMLNELDGFHLAPRLRLNFSGAINPATLKAGVVLVWLDNLTNEERGLAPMGQLTGINQAVYDPATLTAYAKPDEGLDQHRRYALIVTDSVQDTAGDAIGADPAFTACIEAPSSAYCLALQKAVQSLARSALPGRIIGASLFTTLSATTWLEKARDLVANLPTAYQPLGAPVKTEGITSIDWKAQETVNPVTFRTLSLRLPAGTLDGIDRISVGTYSSPNFLNDRQYIPGTPTGSPLALPAARRTIQVNAYIPSSPMPASGFPVLVHGHGFGSNAYVTSTFIASTFAKAGIATIAINVVGHGGGPQSSIQLVRGGSIVGEFPGFGRGVDLNGDGKFEAYEGCFHGWPTPVGVRDCHRQTVVDLMQLINVLRSGAAFESSGGMKFDPARISYLGASLGGMYGAMLQAVDSRITAAVLNVGGGSNVDIARWAPTYRARAQEWAGGARVPSLLNAGTDFNEEYVLRNQPTKVVAVPGAIDIQNLFGELEWLHASGDPLSYAPHLQRSPLPSVQPRPVLVMSGLGDQSVPAPATTALIREAGMAGNSVLYRADLAAPVALQVCCRVAADSHGYFIDFTSPAALLISRAAQQVATGFLGSGGKTVPDGNEIFQKSLPFASTVKIFDSPGPELETLHFGRLGIPSLENLKIDETPVIRSVTSATGTKESVQPTVQPGSWMAIYGSYLSAGTADWTGLVNNGRLPTALNGVSVTIGGKAAYVYFVSPKQINVVTPDVAAGVAPVVVTTNGVSTPPISVRVGVAAPAFFQWGASKYAVTTRYPDNTNIGAPSIGFVAAKPGDVLILWATGLGDVTPPQPPGELTDGIHNVAAVSVTLGELSVPVIGAALSPGLAGVYQIAIQLPADTPAGEVMLKASTNGVSSPDNVYLFVER